MPHVAHRPGRSVLVFDGQCWHAGGVNRSDALPAGRVRPLPGGAVDALPDRPDDRLPRQRWDRMTDRQRELLRMVHGVDQRNAADYYPSSSRAPATTDLLGRSAR